MMGVASWGTRKKFYLSGVSVQFLVNKVMYIAQGSIDYNSQSPSVNKHNKVDFEKLKW